MNIVLMCGRLTADPDVNDKRATFSIAVDRKFKKDGEPTADFFRCVAFGKTKDFIEKYLVKGTKIIIEGSLQTGKYIANDGTPRTTTDIILNSVEFAESKRSREEDFKDAENIDGLPFF